MRTVVITATGTGVGKTRVGKSLVETLSPRCEVVGLKPIESGYLADSSDARALGNQGVWIPPLYALREAVSPHLAARAEAKEIELERVRGWVDRHRAKAVTVVETAGGLFSPLTDTLTNLDLVRALEPCVWILVAPNRLGVLHDVGAVLRAARSEHRAPDTVWLNPLQLDLSSATNAGELRRVHPAQQVFELSAAGSPSSEALVWLLDCLGLQTD